MGEPKAFKTERQTDPARRVGPTRRKGADWPVWPTPSDEDTRRRSPESWSGSRAARRRSATRGRPRRRGLSARWACPTARFITALMRRLTRPAVSVFAVQIGSSTAMTSLPAPASTRMSSSRGTRSRASSSAGSARSSRRASTPAWIEVTVSQASARVGTVRGAAAGIPAPRRWPGRSQAPAGGPGRG